MKKLDNIVGIALVSWGMMLLCIVMWLGNKYPEIQQDLLLIVYRPSDSLCNIQDYF